MWNAPVPLRRPGPATRLARGVLVLCLLAAGCGSGDPARTSLPSPGPVLVDGYPFVPFRGSAREPDVLNDRLCADADAPEEAPDKIFIPCRLEGGTFSPLSGFETPDGPVKVVAYNLERGRRLDAQLAFFREDPDFRDPDILLLSEADRGCSRSGDRNVLREYARALDMNYVYGVEFVEIARETGNPDTNIEATCEHGNGIVSRFPLGNVRLMRHVVNQSWYDSTSQPRLGGRATVIADVLVGGRVLHLYSVHLESGVEDYPTRVAQAAEIVVDAAPRPFPVIVGGDMNTSLYVVDLILGENLLDTVVPIFLAAGFGDVHLGIPFLERATSDDNVAGIHGVLDLILARGLPEVEDRFVCPLETCEAMSDHMPIGFSFGTAR